MLALKSSTAKKCWESFEIYGRATSEGFLSDQSGWCEFEKRNEVTFKVMISTFHKGSKNPKLLQKQLSWSETTGNKVDEDFSEEERKYFKIIVESQAGFYEDLAEDKKTSKLLQSHLHYQLPRTLFQTRTPQLFISGGQYKPNYAYKSPRYQTNRHQRQLTVPMILYENPTEVEQFYKCPSARKGWSCLILPRAQQRSTIEVPGIMKIPDKDNVSSRRQEDMLSSLSLRSPKPQSPVHYMRMDELWANLEKDKVDPTGSIVLTVIPSTYPELQAYPAGQITLSRIDRPPRIPVRTKTLPYRRHTTSSRIPVRIKNLPYRRHTTSSRIPVKIKTLPYRRHTTPSRIPVRIKNLPYRRHTTSSRIPVRTESLLKGHAMPSRIPVRTKSLPYRRHTTSSQIPVRTERLLKGHAIPSRIPVRIKHVPYRRHATSSQIPVRTERLLKGHVMPSRIPLRIERLPRRRRARTVTFADVPHQIYRAPLVKNTLPSSPQTRRQNILQESYQLSNRSKEYDLRQAVQRLAAKKMSDSAIEKHLAKFPDQKTVPRRILGYTKAFERIRAEEIEKRRAQRQEAERKRAAEIEKRRAQRLILERIRAAEIEKRRLQKQALERIRAAVIEKGHRKVSDKKSVPSRTETRKWDTLEQPKHFEKYNMTASRIPRVAARKQTTERIRDSEIEEYRTMVSDKKTIPSLRKTKQNTFDDLHQLQGRMERINSKMARLIQSLKRMGYPSSRKHSQENFDEKTTPSRTQRRWNSLQESFVIPESFDESALRQAENNRIFESTRIPLQDTFQDPHQFQNRMGQINSNVAKLIQDLERMGYPATRKHSVEIFDKKTTPRRTQRRRNTLQEPYVVPESFDQSTLRQAENTRILESTRMPVQDTSPESQDRISPALFRQQLENLDETITAKSPSSFEKLSEKEIAWMQNYGTPIQHRVPRYNVQEPFDESYDEKERPGKLVYPPLTYESRRKHSASESRIWNKALKTRASSILEPKHSRTWSLEMFPSDF